MDELYDFVVVGGGPAGMAAAIYGGRARLKVVVIDKKGYGGQASTTAELENYPGFGEGTTGPGLMEAMYSHATHFGAQFVRDEVVDVDLKSHPKKVVGRNNTFLGKAVILCPGAEPRMIHVPGERQLRGKGVSYCATCDADFFEDLEVVVVGSGDAAVEEAMYLTKFAEKVTVVVLHDEGIVDANQVSAERAFANPKISWIWNSVVDSINGEGIVESVTIKNLKTGELHEYPTNGVFIFVGTEPKTEIFRNSLELDDHGYIKTNDKMATSVEGVYAAGDAIVKYLRQVVTAVADGAIAAVAAERYIHESEGFEQEVLMADRPVVVVYYDPRDLSSMETSGQVDAMVDKSGGKAKMVKVDASRNEFLTRRYNVRTVPHLQVFVDGKVVLEQSGSIDSESLKKFL